jgi:hypothetical protein
VPSWACLLTTHVTASFTWGIRSQHKCRNYCRYKITKHCTTRINRYLQNMSNEQNDHLFNMLHQCLGRNMWSQISDCNHAVSLKHSNLHWSDYHQDKRLLLTGNLDSVYTWFISLPCRLIYHSTCAY